MLSSRLLPPLPWGLVFLCSADAVEGGAIPYFSMRLLPLAGSRSLPLLSRCFLKVDGFRLSMCVCVCCYVLAIVAGAVLTMVVWNLTSANGSLLRLWGRDFLPARLCDTMRPLLVSPFSKTQPS